MKTKHYATLALAAWTGMVTWVGMLVVDKPVVLGPQQADEDGAVTAQLQQQIAQADRLRQGLQRLAGAPVRPAAGRLLEETAAAPSPAEGAEAGAPAPAHAPRTLSLILTVDRERRAIIDGELVQRGSRLEDGARVLAIGSDWVRLQDADGQTQTLRLAPPYGQPAAPAGAAP